jgi:hypothetical protein
MDFPLSNLGRDAELASLRSRLAEAEARVADLEGPACKNCFGHKLADARDWVPDELAEKFKAENARLREALNGAADYLASAADTFRNGCKQLSTEVIDAYWRKVDELRALSPAPEPKAAEQEKTKEE